MRRPLEDDATGELFHLVELLTQPSVIADGPFHLDELLCGQRDANSLLRDFAGPLVAGTAALRPDAQDVPVAGEVGNCAVELSVGC